MIKEEDAKKAIYNIKSFYSEIESVMEKYSLGEVWRSDTCRKNSFLSPSQEIEFSKVLDGKHSGKISEADILHITEDGKEIELECKITSPDKNGTVNLWTDYSTLEKKKNLSYLYMIHKDMKNVCLLYFKDLSIENFRIPSKTSKNKSKMKIKESLDKCTPILGDIKISEGKRKSLKILYVDIEE